MAGIGNYQKNRSFALKSGNKPTFKMMGSSPLKTHKPGHVKGTPKGGGFRDYPEGKEPSKKTKIKEYNTSKPTPTTPREISKHLSLNMKTGEMELGGNRARSVDKNKKELARGLKNVDKLGKKASPAKKAGCTPGDPGCGGNFKIKKKSRIGRALKKATSWVGDEVKDIKSKIRKRKTKKKNYRDSDGGSHKTVRYL